MKTKPFIDNMIDNTTATTKSNSETNENELVLVIKSLDQFSQFLNRFSKMEDQLLMELTPLHLKAKMSSADKTALKAEKVDLESIFEIENFEEIPDEIKIGILNIKKLTEAFKHFTDKQVTLKIKYVRLNKQVVSEGLELNSSSLSINFDCADIGLFKPISDELLNQVTAKTDSSVFFKLTKDQFYKVLDLTKFVNSKEDFIAIDIDKNKNIVFESSKLNGSRKNKSFSYIIDKTDISTANFETVYFKKEYFEFVDKDIDLIFYVKDAGILIEAADHSSLKILIGRANV